MNVGSGKAAALWSEGLALGRRAALGMRVDKGAKMRQTERATILDPRSSYAALNGVALHEVKYVPDVEPACVERISSLTLDLTHSCPFRCPGCIEGHAMRQSQRGALSTCTACDLIGRFADSRGEELLLYGGEPTSHNGFGEVVRFAAAKVRRIRVVTNGAYLEQPDVTRALWAAGEQAEVSVRVSLNAGTGRTHELLHRAKRFFTRVVRSMKQLTEGNGRLELGVSFVVEEFRRQRTGEKCECFWRFRSRGNRPWMRRQFSLWPRSCWLRGVCSGARRSVALQTTLGG